MNASARPVQLAAVIPALLFVLAVLLPDTSQTAERTGKFTLLGTVVFDDGSPVVGKDVDVPEVDDKGGIRFKVGSQGTGRPTIRVILGLR